MVGGFGCFGVLIRVVGFGLLVGGCWWGVSGLELSFLTGFGWCCDAVG